MCRVWDATFFFKFPDQNESLNCKSLQVNAFFTRIIIENEEHPDEQQEGLQDNIRSIQEICFFLKTFCSETELHTQLLKNHDAIAIPDVIKEQLDNSDLEFQPPENPNEIYPFELYPEIFTYETVDPAKCKKH